MLATKLFKSKVPDVKVNVLVEPRVRLLSRVTVPIPRVIVIGKSNDLPFVWTVFDPVVPSVVTPTPADIVPPEEGAAKLP